MARRASTSERRLLLSEITQDYYIRRVKTYGVLVVGSYGLKDFLGLFDGGLIGAAI
jgi:hypothetical protein